MHYVIATTPECQHCKEAVRILDNRGMEYETILLDTPEARRKFKEGGNFKTVPQIWHGNTHIGGLTEFKKHVQMLGDA